MHFRDNLQKYHRDMLQLLLYVLRESFKDERARVYILSAVPSHCYHLEDRHRSGERSVSISRNYLLAGHIFLLALADKVKHLGLP